MTAVEALHEQTIDRVIDSIDATGAIITLLIADATNDRSGDALMLAKQCLNMARRHLADAFEAAARGRDREAWPVPRVLH